MNVFILVGTSGAGKTSVLDRINLPSVNPVKLHSMLKPTNHFNLSNNLMLAKWNYIADWYNTILSLYRNGVNVVISDRTPLEVAGYANNGHFIMDAIKQTNHELNSLEEKDENGKLRDKITLYFIYLHTDPKEMFFRKEKRKLNHNNKTWDESERFFMETHKFYQDNIKLWHPIENITLAETVTEVEKFILNNI